jgi:threonine/homoserine/homoserine lactone efflux protein
VIERQRRRADGRSPFSIVAVLPSSSRRTRHTFLVGLLLAIVHDLEGIAWFSGIILAAHSARTILDGWRLRRGIDGATGGYVDRVRSQARPVVEMSCRP